MIGDPSMSSFSNGDAEILLEQCDQFRAFGGRELHACGLALRRDDAEGQRLLAHGIGRHARLDDLEWADAERDEIRRQRLRWGETVRDHCAGGARARFGRVREDLGALGRGDRDCERRLETGLVEAREHAARVDGLHLRPRVPLVADLRVEQAFRASAEAGGVIESQCDFAGGQLAGEIEAGDTGIIHFRVLCDDACMLLCRDLRFTHMQAAAVQKDRARWLGKLRLYFGVAAEVLLRRVDRELQAIARRLQEVRQRPEWRRGSVRVCRAHSDQRRDHYDCILRHRRSLAEIRHAASIAEADLDRNAARPARYGACELAPDTPA
jgi:hypothetical protein